MPKEKDEKLPKSLIRIIDIIMRMLQGEKLNSEDAAQLYEVNKRTIYRDLQIIRENPIFNSRYEIEFDPIQKNRFVVSDEKISFPEILAIIKIIMGTRALDKAELTTVVKHLGSLVATKDQLQLDKLLKNSYIPVKTNGNLIQRIGDFTKFIETRTSIEYTYQGSLPKSDNKRIRHGVPLSLYFSDFYFYVVIFNEEKGTRTHRLDRIISYNSSNRSINIPREEIEDESSIRNYTYRLNGGSKSYFKIKYMAYPQSALDRLPNSRVVSHEADGSVIIEGYMHAQGMKLWVLGQGAFVKVLEPQSLIEQVKKELQASLDQYK